MVTRKKLSKTYADCMNKLNNKNYCTKLVNLIKLLLAADAVVYFNKVYRVVRIPANKHRVLVGLDESVLLVALEAPNYIIHFEYQWNRKEFTLVRADVVTLEKTLLLNQPPPPSR